ncbi:protein nrt1/ ptr family 5.4, partial [Quercus suber]
FLEKATIIDNIDASSESRNPWRLCSLNQVFGVVVTNISTYFTKQELFYDQMPESLRSLGAAAYISFLGVGSFISSAIISIVQAISSSCGEKWLGNNLHHAHIDYFYWLLAGLSFLNLCVYIWIAMRYMYKKLEGDEMLA